MPCVAPCSLSLGTWCGENTSPKMRTEWVYNFYTFGHFYIYIYKNILYIHIMCMYVWMDGWMDEWMYACMYVCTYVSIYVRM